MTAKAINKESMMAKRISVFGDSISTFEGLTPPANRCYYSAEDPNGTGVTDPSETWWMQTIEALGGHLCANGSFSGSMVAGAGFPAGCSEGRAQQVISPQGDAPDTVLVFIGINDYGWGGAENQAKGGSEAAPAEVGAPLGGFNPEHASAGALQEFAQAYDRMLENIKAQAPQAEVWCFTLVPGRVAGQQRSTFCYRLRGVDVREYNKVIRCVAQANGCKVADIAAFGMDYEASDGTHPTRKGMQQLAALAIAAMVDSPFDRSVFPDDLASDDSCTRESCIGCEHARSTGVRWSCVCEKELASS